MSSAIPVRSSASERRAWLEQLGGQVGATEAPVWGWVSALHPAESKRFHIPVNRLQPLEAVCAGDSSVQGGADFWLLTRYQGHVLAAVVPNLSGVWSARSERFAAWGWT